MFITFRTGGGCVALELPKKEVAGPDNSIVNHKFQVCTQTDILFTKMLSNCSVTCSCSPDGSFVQFDAVFDDASQEDVFRETMQKHMNDVLQGYSAAVLAYGATSSGKTYTMSGNRASYSHRGLIPRALSHLFTVAEAATDRFITTTITCLEIYNDQMYDLLADKLSEASNLHCLEDSAGGIEVKVCSSSFCTTQHVQSEQNPAHGTAH